MTEPRDLSSRWMTAAERPCATTARTCRHHRTYIRMMDRSYCWVGARCRIAVGWPSVVSCDLLTHLSVLMLAMPMTTKSMHPMMIEEENKTKNRLQWSSIMYSANILTHIDSKRAVTHSVWVDVSTADHSWWWEGFYRWCFMTWVMLLRRKGLHWEWYTVTTKVHCYIEWLYTSTSTELWILLYMTLFHCIFEVVILNS